MNTLSYFSRTLCQLALSASLLASFNANAQHASRASGALSALPIASVMVVSAVGASAVTASAGAAIALPAALSVAGSTLVVVSVEVLASGTVYVLRDLSDGAVASIKLAGSAVAGSAMVAGAVITVSAMTAGTLLVASSKVVAFLPNEVGRSLMHNERLTYERPAAGSRP